MHGTVFEVNGQQSATKSATCERTLTVGETFVRNVQQIGHHVDFNLCLGLEKNNIYLH